MSMLGLIYAHNQASVNGCPRYQVS